MTILYFENYNALEEMEIIKATTSDHMLNIMQNNYPLYKIQPLQDQTATGTVVAEDALIWAKDL